MASKPTSTTATHRHTFKKRRRGVHAKTKHSNAKGSKFYVKPNRGQGVR